MKIYCLIFFTIWLVYGAFINDVDLKNYNIYHDGAEAVAIRGDFELWKSPSPMLTQAGGYDTFTYEGKQLAAKQPGALLVGGVAYFFLHHIFGFAYETDYYHTAALVSFLTASLLSALATILFYFILTSLRFPSIIAAIGAFSWAFASMQFPYSTVLHHDSLANSILVVSIFFLMRSQTNIRSLYLSGFFAGLAGFFSALPFPVCVGISFWVLLQYRFASWRFVVGAVFGFLPILLYNNHYFGSPFLNANVVGKYQDTLIDFTGKYFFARWHDYLGWGVVSIWKHFPLLPLGFIGFFFAPKIIRWAGISSIIFQFLYVLNIDSIGTCCYGPRYLLPLTIFASLGIPYLTNFSSKTLSVIGKSVVGIVIIYSCVVYTLGAWGGTVYCHFHGFAARAYLLDEGVPENQPTFPLWQKEER